MTIATSRPSSDPFPAVADLASLWRLSPGLLVVTDPTGIVDHASGAWESVLGWPIALLVDRPLLDFVHPEDAARLRTAICAEVGARIDHLECRLRTRDGGWRHLTWRAERRDSGWTFVAEDVTRRRELEISVTRDPLTGVLNRRACMERLGHALGQAERTGRPVAVIFLDLDGFKGVNDTLGHAVGDRVLAEVASRLESVLRRSDFLARIGGDEFVVLAGAPEEAGGLDQLAERLRTAVAQPIDTGSGRVVLGVSMGAVLARGGDAEDLVAEADAALYRAKASGRGRVVWFDDQLRAEMTARQELSADLRGILARSELEVHFQPIVSLRDQAPIGTEALLRWRHPAHGLLEPGAFLDIVEHDGLMAAVGSWVFEQACAYQRRWRREGRDVAVSVNVSAGELGDETYPARVAAILDRTGAHAASMTLELTETTLLTETTDIASTLGELRALGLQIALDDFGRGTSSLEHLRSLPVDIIKIDRTFVEGISISTEDRAIVEAMIALAKATGRSVVAEGIETEAQLLELLEMGCPSGQGFYFAPAMRAEELALDGFVPQGRRGIGDPTVIREFMRQIGIPARIR